MKYFLHSTDSFEDEKIAELFIEYGYEGVGLFYTTLEKIGKQEKPIKTSVLKSQLKVGKKLSKCWEFMEKIGIISSNNGETFNERILSYSEKYQIKKEKDRERISQWREKQKDIENVTCYEEVRNIPKVKESKVKVIYTYSVEKLEEMIVKEMMAIWMKLKPRYKSEDGLDFTACLEIAYRIGWELGIEKSKIIFLGDTTNLNDLLILEKWEEYLSFIVTDNYFNKLTVMGVSNKKNWQSILNSIEYKPNEDKERLSESKRITPEQYFKS